MSHIHVEQLRVVDAEFLAVKRAMRGALADPSQTDYGQLLRAVRNLETTYVTRLFSQFESILRFYLRAQHPGRRIPQNVGTLINRIALLHAISDPIRDAAHEVRVYRNSVVHADGTATAAITFEQSRRNLNRFLSLLP